MALDLFKLSGTVDVQTGKAEAGLRRVDAASRQTQSALSQADQSARKASGGFSLLADRLKGLSAVGGRLSIGVAAPLGALGALATQTAVKLDSLKRGLTAVAGSSQAAEAQLKRLQQVAQLPGLGFEEAIRGSINLQAAGLSAEEAEQSLKGFGNALATVGKGKADLDGVVTALAQIQSKGKVSAEEINQLAERVPQIRQILIGAFGSADTELLQRAGITSKEFVEVVNNELKKLPAVTGGAQNALENFDDTRKRVFGQFGDALLRVIVPAVEKLTPVIEKIGNGFAALSPTTQTVIVAIAGLAVAVGPVLIALGSMASAISAVGTVLGGGGLLATIGPVIAVLAALGVAAFALYKAWQTNFLGIRDITKKVIDAVKAFFNGGWRDSFNAAKNLALDFVATLEGFWNSIPDGLKSALEKLGEFFKGAFTGLISLASDLGSKIGSALLDALNSNFNGLGDKIIEKLKSAYNSIKEFFDNNQPSASSNIPSITSEQLARLEAVDRGGASFPSITPEQLARLEAVDRGGALGLPGAPSRAALLGAGGVSTAGSGDFLTSIKNTEGYRKFKNAIEAAGGDVFLEAVKAVADRRGANPADLLGVIGFESRVNPEARNPLSGFSGLIQASPDTARAFFGAKSKSKAGALAEVRAQSAIKQLEGVDAYLAQFGQALDTTEKVYSAVLRGRVMSDPNSVLFTAKSGKAFTQNAPLDRLGNNDQVITLNEAAAQITRQGFEKAVEGARQFQSTLKDAVPVVNEIRAATDPIPTTITSIATSANLIPPAIKQATTATQQFAAATSEASIAEKKAALEARVRRQDALEDLKKVQQASLGIGENLDIKAQIAQIQAINELRQADEDATLSMISNRMKLADKTVFHVERGKAAVLQFLQDETKGITEIASDTRIGVIKTAFDGIQSAFDKLTEKLGPFRSVISQILTDLTKLTLSKIFQRIFGLGGGGSNLAFAGAPAGGGSPLGGAFGSLTGGGSSAGNFLTGGFAGGNPAAAILGGGGTGGGGGLLGGILGKIPGLGKLFGGGYNPATNPGGLGFVDAAGNPVGGAASSGLGGALGSLGAGGLLMGGGLLGSLAGGKSPIGRLLGMAGGTLLGGALGATGIFGSGIASALPALFSNPVTAIIGGALIGGAFLARLFGNKILKSLRGLIRGEYGIEVKSNPVLENVKALGESKFGKEFKRKQIETVRLPDVRELLYEYAQRTNQRGNSKLFSAGNLQDPYNPMNSFPRREFGGPVLAGHPYIVGERRPELFIPNQSGRIAPSVPGGQGSRDTMMMDVLLEVAAAVRNLRGIPKGQLVEQGLRENPEAATIAVDVSFQRRSPASIRVRDKVNAR